MNEKPSFQHPEEQWTYHNGKDMRGEGPLYEQGLVTHKSLIRETKLERPLAERVDRAEFYDEVLDKRKELKRETIGDKIRDLKECIKNIFSKAKKKDKIYTAFLDNKPVSVDMGILGTQKIDYVDINTEYTDNTKNPIFIIMGIGNDSNGNGSFPHELAMETDRRIILLPQPDSYHGKVTGRFMLAELFSRKFGPHTKFFKSVIEQICEKKEIEKFDICGISAGAVITSNLIKDKELTKRIDKKNLVTPPGITPIYENPIKRWKMQNKTMEDQKEKGNQPRAMVVDFEMVQKSWIDRIFQQGTFYAMALKLAGKYQWWKNLEDTNVIIAREDGLTYGIKHIDKIRKNKKLTVIEIDGGHEVVPMEPKKVIEKMDL